MIANLCYPFSLPPLPYAYEALEPHIDKETMHYHHDKHLNTYVGNLNAALEKYPDCQTLTLEQLLSDLEALPEGLRGAVRNNGGGVYNHDLYFDMLSPETNQEVPEKIAAAFGGAEEMKKQLKAAGLGQFGSGFAWLVQDSAGELKIMALPNQDNPLSQGYFPLLPLDVWEHAYYLRYQNLRPDYIDNWFAVVNWKAVEARMR